MTDAGIPSPRGIRAPGGQLLTRDRLVVAGLLALCVVPVVAGGVRTGQLATHTATADNARYLASPVPVLLHIVAVTAYGVLGAFQFHSGLRRRRPRLHRALGRVLLPAGVVVALTGLWMTFFYPPLPTDSVALRVVRLAVGTGMLTELVLGFVAIRRRDVRRHRAGMIRAYALAMGAGTQVFTVIPWVVATGSDPGTGPRAVLMTAAWVINLAVAERIIRRGRRRSPAGARTMTNVSPATGRSALVRGRGGP